MYVICWVAANGEHSGLLRVNELPVASAGAVQDPSVLFQTLNDIPNLHCTSVLHLNCILLRPYRISAAVGVFNCITYQGCAPGGEPTTSIP